MITISKKQARRLLLYQQGLTTKVPFGKGKAATLKAIKRLGYVQIDTISVIERAHHHTLLTRVPNYCHKHLKDLLQKDKAVFEYWSHAAAYLPMDDYRFSLWRKKRFAESKKGHWFPRNHKVIQYVRDQIKAEGPLLARDFKLPDQKKSSPWWGWKPTKQALEQLFHEGELMIPYRKNFQKVYDLTERVLPEQINTSFPSEKEYCTHLALKTIEAQGLARENEIRYLRKKLKEPISQVLKNLVEEDLLVTVNVDGVDGAFFTLREYLRLLPICIAKKSVRLLCPFDNAIIQRQRVIDLFGFDYKLECYVPAPKRKFGYFSLAVLYGDEFAAHLDMKTDRKAGSLLLRKLTFDNGFKPSEAFYKALMEAVVDYAKYNKVQEVVIKDLKPIALRKALAVFV